jgi:two-component system chemotaxis response regulator CheY
LQAIQEYRIHQPDLVTMDVTMPKLDGINTVRNIITEFPQAGIIMVSGFNDRNTVIEALKTGAKHYIIKPISKEKLLAVINEVLCRQQGSGDGQTD